MCVEKIFELCTEFAFMVPMQALNKAKSGEFEQALRAVVQCFRQPARFYAEVYFLIQVIWVAKCQACFAGCRWTKSWT